MRHTQGLMLVAMPMALLGMAIALALAVGAGLLLALVAPPLLAYGVAVRARQLVTWLKRLGHR